MYCLIPPGDLPPGLSGAATARAAKLHELMVTLAEKGTGYSIQARHSYLAPRNEAEAKAEAKEVEASSGADQGQEQIREALLSKAEIGQFPVSLDAKVSQGKGETRELSLLSHVDPKSLHLQTEGGHNLDTLTFVFGVFDQKGNLVIAQQRHANVDVADGQLPEFLKAGISVDMAIRPITRRMNPRRKPMPDCSSDYAITRAWLTSTIDLEAIVFTWSALRIRVFAAQPETAVSTSLRWNPGTSVSSVARAVGVMP
jgi:hypothetical protein